MLGDSVLLEEIADLLRECALFRDFSEGELKAVARYVGSTKVAGGETVFREGDPGEYMGIVMSGSISVQKEDDDGELVEIAKLPSGRVFGEMAVLDGERRSATCIASGESMLLTLTKEALDKMIDDTPRVAAKVIRAIAVSLSRRLRMADGKLVEMRD
ncbi:MAG: cyclic nucleotide-binding domain-containing protein [Pseudomonadota bacterium]